MTAQTGVTVWSRGRLDARVGPRQLLFGRMYEDVGIELDVFPPGGKVFCIASAGCTAMRLAPRHDEVVAVDINPVQLAYARQRLDGEPAVRGRAERVMDLARFFAPLAGWSRRRVDAFLDLDDPEEQRRFWDEQLDTRRFRWSLDALFSLVALRAVYSPRLLELLPDHLGAVMRGRLARAISRHPNRTNPFARALFVGDLSADTATPEASRVTLVEGDAASVLEAAPPGSFQGFTLSNILDGADDAYAERLHAAIRRAATPDAVVVLRSFREPDGDDPTNRAADDRSMLWGQVLVRAATGER